MDRRQNSRFQTGIDLSIVVLGENDDHRVAARVLDVSPSGLRLETGVRIEADSAIRIDLFDEILLGEVRYCAAAAEPDRFYCGIVLSQSLKHLSDLGRLVEKLLGSPLLTADQSRSQG